jgi:hypothetical protein
MSARWGAILVATIAIAAAAGIAVSRVNRSLPPTHAAATVTPVSLGPTPVPRRPLVAFEFSVADDPSAGDVVLFGGVDNFANTWLWNGDAWTLAHPALSPPGRYGAAVAYDPESGQVLLFGGRLEPGTPVNDTWGWDGRSWEELDAGAGGATPGDGAAMAWDPARNQMLLVTRPAAATGGGQTWIWTGTRWQRQLDGDLGSSYFGILVGYDPVSRSMLAEGCCQVRPSGMGSVRSSTWRWDGSTWLTVATSVSPPGGTALAIDPARGELVICNCDLVGGIVPGLLAWTGRTWVAIDAGPVPPQPQAEVDDVSRSQFLLLGFAIDGADSFAQSIEVWAEGGASWRQLDNGPGSG